MSEPKALSKLYFIVTFNLVFSSKFYPKHAPDATATALPPELPPAMYQSFSGMTSSEAEVFNLKLRSGFRQIFFVGPKAESMAPELTPELSLFVCTFDR